MIHKPQSQLEADLLAKDALVIRAAEATHHLANVLKCVHQEFWSLPTDRLLAVLNADIPATLQTFAANTALGTVCNANLDAIDLAQLSTRAPLETGRSDIVFDGAQFVFIPPPAEEEAEPVPQPEPQPE